MQPDDYVPLKRSDIAVVDTEHGPVVQIKGVGFSVETAVWMVFQRIEALERIVLESER